MRYGRSRAGFQLLGGVMITSAVLVTLLLVWQLWGTDRVADAAARQEISSLQRQWAATPVVPQARVLTTAPKAGKAFAVLHVPRFGARWQAPVVQGTSTGDLRRGVGHYPSSALPGAVGNLGIAGHRTTWGAPFDRIAQLRRGDPVEVETASGWFVYSVTGHEIVRPGNDQVLAAVPGHPRRRATTAQLTLTSCHPKYSARQRYVVHAELTSSRARGAGAPSSGGL